MVQKNVLEYLEKSAARFPDKPAFSDEEQSFSFSSLMAAAKALGTRLGRAFHETGRPVGVLVTRNAACLAAFFGVLYSGNYYVPIDPEMPDERRRLILDTVKPLCVIDPMEKDCFFGDIDEELLFKARSRVLDIDPVYAIFTSGSTGVPKGILISHRAVIDFTDWFVEAGTFTENDVMGNQAPFYFDLSVKDIYTVLATGASAWIIPKKYFVFTPLLADFTRQHKITAFVWATSAFHLVANSGILEKGGFESIRTCILGGEALRAKQLNIWKKALPGVRYINLYGPTEVTVDCTWLPIDRDYDDAENIPIGYACCNKEVLLLNDELEVCRPGEPGEICVRGIGLAKGYFGDWEKTHAAFIQDPRNKDYPDTIYRTGDIGVMAEDGCISFLSRRDGQIKHMGYRIELGEVEAALSGMDGITEVMCFFDGKRDKIHCAYSGSGDSSEIAKLLRTRLPKYMLPNIYHNLEALPHNPNGKIDRPAIKKAYLEEDVK